MACPVRVQPGVSALVPGRQATAEVQQPGPQAGSPQFVEDLRRSLDGRGPGTRVALLGTDVKRHARRSEPARGSVGPAAATTSASAQPNFPDSWASPIRLRSWPGGRGPPRPALLFGQLVDLVRAVGDEEFDAAPVGIVDVGPPLHRYANRSPG